MSQRSLPVELLFLVAAEHPFRIRHVVQPPDAARPIRLAQNSKRDQLVDPFLNIRCDVLMIPQVFYVDRDAVIRCDPRLQFGDALLEGSAHLPFLRKTKKPPLGGLHEKERGPRGHGASAILPTRTDCAMRLCPRYVLNRRLIADLNGTTYRFSAAQPQVRFWVEAEADRQAELAASVENGPKLTSPINPL